MRDYIDLQSYGQLHSVVNILYFFFLLFLLVACIIEIVRYKQKKEKNKAPLFIFIGVFLVFSMILFVHPYNPKLFTNYKYTLVWKGGERSEDATFFKVFNAYGRLKLSNNGRFILNWRSIIGPTNYYGDWSINKDTLILSYYGLEKNRVGTKLVYLDGKLYSYNGRNAFNSRSGVVFESE